ncbi:MAG TPA: tRNA pseudouridine(55) synthase TruB, partial [Acidimicrobiales bacterium]|nr:tRNA pseudouridine(55) synthase TruB [Acidimicrobiales bacterium]
MTLEVPGAGELDGCLVIDKPAGWTSHDVVARVRRLLGTRKVGHAGTLDPDATGVLLLGIGRATRLLRFATMLTKTYVGEVVLGVATNTLDASGEVTERCDMADVDLEAVRMAALSLTGRLEQIPPMVSAVKVGGRRLHELAREGVEIERQPRPVEVHRYDVFATSSPLVFSVMVECSSGTYVRVLAADLGHRLGGVAHLRTLRRVAVGSFRDVEAVNLDDVTPAAVRPSLELVRDMPSAAVEGDVLDAIGHGRFVERARLQVAGDGPWALVGPDGRLVA